VTGTDVDVAVVGASPAGLSAAARAARAGADVELVEASRVGHPEPPAVVGFDHVWPDAVDPPEAAVRRRFKRVRLASPAGHAIDVRAPGRVVDRTRLDRWVAGRAREAGARVTEGTGPWRVAGPGVLENEARRLAAEVVVFADGARSIVRELVDPVEAPDALVWGVTHEVPAAPPEDGLDLRVGGHAPGGRTQLVPLGEDRLWHWTFARRPKEQAVDLAERALEQAADRHGWPSSALEAAERRHVAPDPVFQRPDTLAGERSLVAGGAGGLGGLEVGLATGRRAGRAAARAVRADGARRRELVAYEHQVVRRFAPAYRGLAELMDLAERTPDAVLDALAEPWTDATVPLDRLAGLAVDDAGARASSLAGLVARAPVRATRSTLAAAAAAGATLS